MNTKARRDRKKTCIHCHRPFTPDKYNYATQKSCKSPACERSANAVRQQDLRDRRKKDSSAYREHLEAEAVRAKNNRLKKAAEVKCRSPVGKFSPADLMALIVGQITVQTGSVSRAECDEVIRAYRREGRRMLVSGGE